MPKMISKNRKHFVLFDGKVHEFNALTEAWTYLFALKPVIHVISTNIIVKRRFKNAKI